MTRRIVVASVLAIGLTSMTGAVSASRPGSQPPTSDPSTSVVPFEDAWSELIAAAQAEGELVTIGGPNVAEGEAPVFQHFADEFGLELTMVTGSSDEIVSRVLAERGQGIYSVDVAVAGGGGTSRLLEAGVFTPMMDQLIRPDAIDRSTGWYVDTIPWHPDDVDQQYCTNYSLRADTNFMPLYYNTDNVTAADLDGLHSWYDLLDPKWKGRFAIGNAAAGEAGTDRILGWIGLGGQEWFDRLLREMDPEVIVVDSAREMSDGLARGEWDFAMFVDSTVPFEEAQELGLPVAPFPATFEEGSPTSPAGNLCVFDQAAHPAAAQLFANWLLSTEGQTAYNELLERFDNVAMRSDAPQGNVPDDAWARITSPNMVVISDPEQLRAADEESLAWFQATFAELGLGS